MKRCLLQFCIIAILSLPLGTSALFPDNLQAKVLKDDFNIVLITIDALRADHLSCYGYGRKTSPNIDKIAEQGIIFKNAIAPSSWTTPSMVSLFTSLYPINHGVTHGFGYRKNVTKYVQEVFSDNLDTLAQILKSHGYTTFAVASNPHLDRQFGFARGFDFFECLFFLPADHVHKTVTSWENEIKKSDKFFLWVHYIDPHYPYHPRKPWIEHYTKALPRKLNPSKEDVKKFLREIPVLKKDPSKFEPKAQLFKTNLIALYDSEINYVDSYVGKLIQKLKLDRNTLIIITSDHGEEFLEHDGLGHGNNLYQETLHIPLIVKLPYSTKKEIVEKHVNLIDIMPTILHILNISSPEQALGKSCWEGKGTSFWQKKILLQKDTPEYNFAELETKSILKTIMTPEWKYIYNYQDKTEQLYNIESDPSELNNLINKNNKQQRQLKKQLFKWISHSKKYPTKKHHFQLSPKEKEKLKGLGYIQ